MKLREKMLRFIEAKAPAAYATINAETISDDDLEVAYREAVQNNATPAAVAGAGTAVTAVAGLNDQVAAAQERIRMVEARANARTAIDASTLPQPAKDRLQRIFAGRDRFVEADVTAAIDEERQYLSRFVESGRVNLGSFDQAQVEDRSVRINGMLDAFFDPAHADHRNTQSFRECYIEITGDRRVSGRLADCDITRMRESLGTNFREAVMDSTSFAVALGDSITRRMIADYNTPSQRLFIIKPLIFVA